MSAARRKDDDLVQQMYKYAKAIVDMEASGWLTRERLGRSHHLQMEIAMHLQVIGEAAASLRRRGADLGADVPLLSMAGMRNRISHDYDGVDWSVAEDVAFEDVPALVDAIGTYMDANGIKRVEIDLSE